MSEPGETGALARTRVRVALALASSALTVAAYPPLGFWPAALLMLAPLVAGLARATPLRAFRLTYGYIVLAAVAIVRWLVHALTQEYHVAAGKAWGLTIGIVLLYSLAPAGAMALFAWLRPRAHAALAPLLFAALYAFSEWVRAVPFALPWLLTAHALAPAPAFLQIADLLGAPGVSFVILSLSGGVGLALATRSARPLAAPALLLGLALGYGPLRAWTLEEGDALRVGVVQASIAQHDRWQEGFARAHTEQHLALTRRALAEAGELDVVVWPETAIDAVLESDPELLLSLRRQVEASRVPILAGAQRVHAGITNSAFLVVPRAGLVESYAKQVLVPFSEHVPSWGSSLLPVLGRMFTMTPYRAGAEPTVFRRLAVPFATPICFEITYPDVVREMHAAGASVLVNLSNDAWFGRTGYAEMHLAHSVFRAVELRSWVVRAANTGISALVDPRGRVVASLGVEQAGALHGEVRASRARTLYARAGDALVLAFLGLVSLAALAAGRRS